MEEPTRETLILRLRDQQDEASWREFDRLYRRYIAAVLRHAGVPESLLDDLIQDILLKMWKALPKFEYDSERGRFRAWLNTVTLNTMRSHFKKERRLRDSLDTDQQASLELFMAAETPPEVERVAEEEWRKHIGRLAWENVMPELSDKVREVYQGILQGREAEAIAEDLGIERNTVYVYRKRAEQRLAREVSALRDLLE